MRFLVLALICAGFSSAGAAFFRTQFPLNGSPEARRRSEWIAGLAGVPASLIGIAVFEAIYKCGRPTLSCFTRLPIPASLKIFLAGALTGSAFFTGARFLFRVWRKKARPCPSVFSFALRAGLAALIVSLCLELFLFNMRHYEHLAVPGLETVTLERGNFAPEGFYFNRASQRYTNYSPFDRPFQLVMYFDETKVRNIRLEFRADAPTTRAEIRINDEAFEFADQSYPVQLTPEIPRSLIVPVRTVGKSGKISLRFPDVSESSNFAFELNRVLLNVKVPLNLSLPRLLLCFFACWFLLLAAPGSALYRQPYDPRSRLQNGFYALSCAAVCVGSGWTLLSTYDGLVDFRAEPAEVIAEINRLNAAENGSYDIYFEMTDAFLERSLSLLHRPSNSLLSAERPYDITYRQRYGVTYFWDRAFYNGRYYSYFGAIPVVFLFLPFKLLTGLNLPVGFALLIFSILTIIGLFALMRRIAAIFFPRAPFGTLILAALAVTALSNVAWALRRGMIYELAIVSGMALSIWAVYFALVGGAALFRAEASGRKTVAAILSAFAAGCCASTAVGCRPTTVFAFLWILAIQIGFRLRSRPTAKKWLLGAMAAFALPVLIIAAVLMRYNDQRFGSILEFGFRYQLSFPNASRETFSAAPGALLLSALAYLFHPFAISYEFPFIAPARFIPLPFNGYLVHEAFMAGIFGFPLMLGLPLLGPVWETLRQKKLTPLIIGGLLAAGGMLLTASAVAVIYRYLIDFGWILAVIAACAWLAWIENPAERTVGTAGGSGSAKDRDRLFFAAAVTTVMIGALLSLSGDDVWLKTFNPLEFERLRYAFSFWL